MTSENRGSISERQYDRLGEARLRALRERDDAQAEVEQLRALLRQVWNNIGPVACDCSECKGTGLYCEVLEALRLINESGLLGSPDG
jgi:hypothetical protein